MRLIGLFIAIALAATAGFAVLKLTGDKRNDSETNVVQNPQSAPQDVQAVDVLVAMNEIPVGTIIDHTMYDRQPWPKHLVLDQFIVAGDNSPGIEGMVTRGPFLAREPLIRSKLANPNDPSFLAAALPPGMRAVTLATDAVSGIAGFVFPGDRVDILFTHEKPMTDEERKDRPMGARPELVTEVLVTDLKVLAVDQRPTSATGEKLIVPTTVSLEASQEDAQKIRLGEKGGTLALALRSIKDRDNKEMVEPTLQKNLTRIEMDDGESSKRPIFIVRGVKVETLEDALEGDSVMPQDTGAATRENRP